MPKDYQPRSIWTIYADTDHQSDPKVLLSSGRRLMNRMASFLIPSFLRPGHMKPQRIHPTSYLDGLRGVASFIVFMGHYTEENLGWYTEPYGLYEDRAPSSYLQLPFVRVIYSARPMVHIFLIISGFVLSYKPLKQIHSHQYAGLANTLSSSVFRRAIRLFLPSVATIFIMAILLNLGISDDRYAERYFDLFTQIHHAWLVCWGLVGAAWAFNDISYPTPLYNPALWTIPVEFSESLLLFVVLLGLSRCIANVRLLLLAGITAFCFSSGQLYTVEFLGGMFIAELILIQDSSLVTPESSPVLPKFVMDEKMEEEEPDCDVTLNQKCMQGFWFANVVCGLYISSWTNNHVEDIWGLAWLNEHTPAPYEGQRVWFCFAAFQIVAACTQLKCLQAIFNTPVAQYLGNISYALYLTHNLCLTILEPRFVPFLDTIFSKYTLWGRQLSWAAGLLFYLPIIIFVADLFWRAIDTPTVKFARWFESKCVVEKRP